MKWISVEDKLPEYEMYAGSDQFVHVLVYSKELGVNCGMYCNGRWEYLGIVDAPVSHWMPLPDAPGET